MRNYNTQLLLTFTDIESEDTVIEKIKESYNFFDTKIFVLFNKEQRRDVYLTYNVEKAEYHSRVPKTISIHRKKETNTLYTINAINKIILDKIGVQDPTFELNWAEFRNTLLLTDTYGVKIVSTQLDRIENF